MLRAKLVELVVAAATGAVAVLAAVAFFAVSTGRSVDDIRTSVSDLGTDLQVLRFEYARTMRALDRVDELGVGSATQAAMVETIRRDIADAQRMIETILPEVRSAVARVDSVGALVEAEVAKRLAERQIQSDLPAGAIILVVGTKCPDGWEAEDTVLGAVLSESGPVQACSRGHAEEPLKR